MKNIIRAAVFAGLTAAAGAANAGFITTILGVDDYVTAARNGDSPAVSAQWGGGTDFFVRGRRGGASNGNPQLETQLFFRFDLSSLLDLALESVTLELNQNSKLNAVNSGDLYLATVTEDWNSSGSAPGFNSTGTADEFVFGNNGPASAGPAVDRSFSIDLTTQAAAWLDGTQDNFGLRMRIEDEFAAASFLVSGENAPRLVVTQVPAPGILLLMGLGLCLLGATTRKKLGGSIS